MNFRISHISILILICYLIASIFTIIKFNLAFFGGPNLLLGLLISIINNFKIKDEYLQYALALLNILFFVFNFVCLVAIYYIDHQLEHLFR